jgi:hypothetical protein
VFLIASIPAAYYPIIWALLALAATVGLIALASPTLFAKLSGVGNRWIDTSSMLAKLDRRIEVDSRILPYSRLLGAAVVASVSLLAFVLYRR